MTAQLHLLGLAAAARGIAAGKFTSVDLATACLERIHARETQLKAWAYLEPEQALAQARACDERPPSSPVHGVPVGVKDIINTVNLPTGYGSQAYLDHYPAADAACVRLLKQAGAVIMGKTVTTEFAFYAPGKTANPHALDHTPGGSSSGSAAAVADFHVPAALGTQTAGSIIRPAAYTGIFGYKPSYGAYSLDGVHPLAPELDTLGGFAREPEDLRLLHGVLSGRRPAAPPAVRPAAVALVRTPAWDEASAHTRDSVIGFARKLAAAGVEVIEPDEDLLQGLAEALHACLARGAARSLGPVVDRCPDKTRPETRDLVAQGRRLDASLDKEPADARDRGRRFLAAVFARADLLLTPSAPDTAPPGLDNTGDPTFNRIWTLLQTPCLNLPLTRGAQGLPVGVQLVCDRGRDEQLFAWAEGLRPFTDYDIEQP